MHLELDVTIDFPHPLIGRQQYRAAISADSFARELAFARTFGFLARGRSSSARAA